MKTQRIDAEALAAMLQALDFAPEAGADEPTFQREFREGFFAVIHFQDAGLIRIRTPDLAEAGISDAMPLEALAAFLGALILAQPQLR